MHIENTDYPSPPPSRVPSLAFTHFGLLPGEMPEHNVSAGGYTNNRCLPADAPRTLMIDRAREWDDPWCLTVLVPELETPAMESGPRTPSDKTPSSQDAVLPNHAGAQPAVSIFISAPRSRALMVDFLTSRSAAGNCAGR